TALLGAVGTVELVEVVPEDREPDVLASRDADLAQLLGRDEQLALLAIVEISDDVQSLHSDTPFQAKIRSRDCARDLGRPVGESPPPAERPQTQGGGRNPSCRGLPKRKISR